MRPLLCVTVMADTLEGLRAARDAVGDADLVEMRLDSVGDPRADGALAGRQRPVIVTCRPAWEGGGFQGSEEERRAILAEALGLGAEYVDVEMRAGFDALTTANRDRVVLSMHDFTSVPGDLDDQFSAMRRQNPAVVKVAVTPNTLDDTCRLLQLAQSVSGPGAVVWVGMGLPGLVTRVLPGRFGSAWTYSGDGVAPGQLPPDRLLGEFRFRSISAESPLYGVVGRPIGHSLSPCMHNAAFGAESLDGVYVPLEARNVDDFLQFSRVFDVKGASVTTPFKIELASRVDEFDELSRLVGAINTIRFERGRLIGRNTDVPGFIAPLRHRLTFDKTRAAVLGAGGAARAVAVALRSEGADVTVYARRPEAAREAARPAHAAAGVIPPPRGSWDLLVNATSAGMAPRVNETPFAGGTYDGRLVYDLVYNPAETRLLREAAEQGLETLGGLDMLVEQAALQFEWWTGRSPNRLVMREAARSRLAQTPEGTIGQ